MAQSGYTPILIYASGTTGNAPSAGNLTSSASGAELALNYFDGKLFYKDASGNVQVLATKGTGPIGGSNTQIQFNNSGALGGSASLTWDGTYLTAGSIKDSALTSGRVTYAGASGLLTDSANMTFNGTTLTVAGLNNTGNGTLGTSTSNTLTVNSLVTSNLLFTDGTYDIGADGANRPRTLYITGTYNGTTVSLSGRNTASGNPEISVNRSGSPVGTVGNGAGLQFSNTTTPSSIIMQEYNAGFQFWGNYNNTGWYNLSTLDRYGNFGVLGKFGVGNITFDNWSGGPASSVIQGANGGSVSFWNGTNSPATFLASNAYYNSGWYYSVGTSKRANLITMNNDTLGNIGFNYSVAGTGPSTAITWLAGAVMSNNGHWQFGGANDNAYLTVLTPAGTGCIAMSGNTTSNILADLSITRTGAASYNVGTAPCIQFNNDTTAGMFQFNGNGFSFFTANGGWHEVMSINRDATGSLVLGAGASPSPTVNAIISANGYSCRTGYSGSWTSNLFNFNWTGSAFMYIDTTNVGQISFVSDYRVKENVETIEEPATPRLMALRVVKFNRKTVGIFGGSDEVEEGWIAHEMQAQIPSAVHGQKDELTSDGQIQPQSLKWTPVVALLNKGFQEQQVLIEQLLERIAALEGKA